ncbi:nucleotide-diphosphate-sugar epimerase [Capsulimonas corticalis]|uniref:Nucleotide-diphosphate-sugar epimerase n=1 Tax=Capsulimonas corticalis TaxID=2219043 RepID=A0A402CTK5_9BACT|nr:NAD(P)H-binding protein [Capsulimonas corticalis]BDI30700.1 nucleotide-diphosphate-sugar epimerase [Capsulimonas corticalis]
MNTLAQDKRILVTGASGNIGSEVTAQLARANIPARALTHRTAPRDLPDHVEFALGDLTDAATLDECLDGIDTVFLVWRLLPLETAPAMLNAFARRARRIVLLSSSAVRDDAMAQMAPIGRLHAEMERLVEQSGMEWTILRPGSFAINTLWWAPQIRAGDVVRWPYANASSSPIHERDIASVAVRALTEEGHAGAKYHLTGPESLTQQQQVRAIGEALGRPLRFEEISPEAARPQMLANMPPPIVDVLLGVWAGQVNAAPPVTDTVAQITGAPAHPYRTWAADHAADFQKG